VHGDVSLGGPVWFFAQVVIFGTLALSVFVLVDSLMPRRRRRVAGRLPEPLWVYSAVNLAYLVLLVAVQLIPGLQFASAIAAVASPVVFAFGVVYLLRVVFPKSPQEPSAEKRPPAEKPQPVPDDDGPFPEL